MKVAIIILNWNGKENTLACLESVGKLETDGMKLTTVVVDNGSTDGSVEAIQNSKFKIIGNKVNLGFSEGNNIGIREALKDGADLVMILNNDTIVDKNLVIQLIETFKKYPKVGIVSPKIYFAPGFEFHKQNLSSIKQRLADPAKDQYTKQEKGKVIWYAGGIIDWNNILASHRGVDEVDKGQYNSIIETDYTSGACMLVKQSVFERVGLFDSKYFLYWEDADLSVRARRAGFKVMYAPPAHIWHKNAGSSHVGGSLHDYYIMRNRLIFGMRYASFRTKFALLRESIVRLLVSKRPWQRRGILDFYLGRLGQGSFRP